MYLLLTQMTPIQKFGLDPSVTKADLQHKIYEIGSKNYDTALRRKNSLVRSQSAASRHRSRSAGANSVGEGEGELMSAEQLEKQKKEEEEKKRRRQKPEPDQYQLTLTVKSAKSVPEDLSVHVERVSEKQPILSTTVLYIPWNKLNSRVDPSHQNEVELVFSLAKAKEPKTEVVSVNIMRHNMSFKLAIIAKMELVVSIDT